MKSRRIDHSSALFGATALGLLLLVTGAGVKEPQFLKLPVESTLTIAGVPSPDQMIRVVDGEPMTVPVGKRLVVTGLASLPEPPPSQRVGVLFDGEYVIQAGLTDGSIAGIPPGLVAQSGTVVEVRDNNGTAQKSCVLLGYLSGT